MSSPLGPLLANIFVCDFEENWWMNAKISPSFWNRYVDDTFTMFHNKDSANEFLHYLNSCQSKINLPLNLSRTMQFRFWTFLSHVIKTTLIFMTSIYRRKTLQVRLYTKWDSNHFRTFQFSSLLAARLLDQRG